MEKSIDYIKEHSSEECEALKWLEKQTNVRTNYPQMLSGAVQGEFLKILARTAGASRILEIGTFTGYSTIFLAQAAGEGGHVDTIEINDELLELIHEGWRRAGVDDRITIYTGDACGILKSFADRVYDFIYIDANKREYCDYYDLAFPLLRKGGLLVADDVLLGGKVYADPPATDAQTKGLCEFNDKVKKDRRAEVVILPVRDGISIIRKI